MVGADLDNSRSEIISSAFWMQTIGATWSRSDSAAARMWMLALSSRSAPGLMHVAAVLPRHFRQAAPVVTHPGDRARKSGRDVLLAPGIEPSTRSSDTLAGATREDDQPLAQLPP